MADDTPAPKKRKKTSPWFEAAQQLRQLPPGIPPKSKDVSTAQRDARLALVRQFWPGVAGAGGRDTCRECRFRPIWAPSNVAFRRSNALSRGRERSEK